MKAFEVKIFSTKIHNLTILTGILSGVACLLLSNMLHLLPLLGIIGLFVLPGLGYFYSKRVSIAEATFTISKNKIKVNWTRNYKIFKKKDEIYNLSDLKSYVIDSQGQFYILKLEDKSGKKNHFAFYSTDQNIEVLVLFLEKLKNAILVFNEKQKDSPKIEPGKNKWQTLPAKASACLLAFSTIYIGFNYVNDVNEYAKLYCFLMLLISTFLVVRKIIIENTKKTAN